MTPPTRRPGAAVPPGPVAAPAPVQAPATVREVLAGVPGISVPGGTVDGLPYGLQFTAPAREDARLYAVGAAVEELVTARRGTPVWAEAPELEKGAARAETRTTAGGAA